MNQMSADAERLALLDRFTDAWNARDVDVLMACMVEDCDFMSSSGTESYGTRYRGREAVRASYEAILGAFPEAAWTNVRHFVCGERGVSEWRFIGRDRNGRATEVDGCDLFVFTGNLICIKNSFRKNRMV